MEAKPMELLAPAGNMECLKTAVLHGADAVYFAGKQFGARSFADNFSEEEIVEAAAYCRLHQVKSYVTVNTMTVDREMEGLDRFLEVLATAGVDGVIVQDLGVLERVRQVCPSMPIHASTQMTVHNLAGVQILERLGASRVVLARELSRDDMAQILNGCQAEIEVFVHGAMCMSYSGQCLMSSVLGGRSGNRGKCAQPCRLGYPCADGGEKAYLSLKDMSLISHLQELRNLGVTSLKIEGRMKGPEYVAVVTDTYRRCLDAMRLPTEQEQNRMNRVFFRGGLTDGYFTGKIGPQMFAFDKPDNPYAQNLGKAAELPPVEKQISVACQVVLAEGAVPVITLTGMGKKVTCCGETILEQAQNRGADIESIKEQLKKTGGTTFAFAPISIEVQGNPFVPVKTVNALRRTGIAALTEAIQQGAKKEFLPLPKSIKKKKMKDAVMGFTVSVQTKEQFDAVRQFPFVAIDVPLHLVAAEPMYYHKERERILLNPPVILPDSRWKTVMDQMATLRQMGFSGLRAENLGVLWAVKEDFRIWGGHRLNLANHLALQTIQKLGVETACLSPELNFPQIRDLQGVLPTEVLAYGHLPLMITENCVRKNMEQCPCQGMGELLDRKGKRFPIGKDGDVCRSVIFNSVPLYMGDKRKEFQQTGVDFCRLFFTIESPEECTAICKVYLEGGDFDGAYTRLHYYKGVK